METRIALNVHFRPEPEQPCLKKTERQPWAAALFSGLLFVSGHILRGRKDATSRIRIFVAFPGQPFRRQEPAGRREQG